MHPSATFRSVDGLLVAAVALMAVFGLVGLASLGLRADQPNFALLTRQAIALGIGFIIFIGAARLDWRAWERGWPAVALVVGALLIGVLFFGSLIRGTRGWFTVFGLTFQPVEFAKIGLILLHAVYFRRRAHMLMHLRTIVESGMITAAIVIPILLQPDLGSALLVIVTWLGMLFVFGLRRAHLIAIVVAAIVVAVIGWSFFLKSYQRDRVQSFLWPNRDPQGTGYNQRQAVIAIGAGGIIGRGFGQGTQAQLRFLPEAQSDFLPAVIGEEFGLLGFGALLACLGVLIWRCAAIARRCPDDFSAAVIVGFGILFGVQASYNLAMNLGIAPVVGVPFPFVSGGGSAIIAFAFGLGIVISIAMRTPLVESRAYKHEVVVDLLHTRNV